MSATAHTANGTPLPGECWCCGSISEPGQMVRLGNHPEVALCVGCAHWAHLQGQEIEDRSKTGVVMRVKDELRAARGKVIERGWHRKPVIGNALRRLGRHLP